MWKNLKLGKQRKQNYFRMTLLNFDSSFFILFEKICCPLISTLDLQIMHSILHYRILLIKRKKCFFSASLLTFRGLLPINLDKLNRQCIQYCIIITLLVKRLLTNYNIVFFNTYQIEWETHHKQIFLWEKKAHSMHSCFTRRKMLNYCSFEMII